MKTLSCFLIILLAACNANKEDKEAKDSSMVISYDSIPEIRKTVHPDPVASYSEPIKDDLNNWRFAVTINETARTFHYLLHLQGKEIQVKDSVTIPNFGIAPKVEIHKGKQPLSCIIGFLNKKGEFMEYLGVSFKDEELHMKTINHYAVNAYKTPVK